MIGHSPRQRRTQAIPLAEFCWLRSRSGTRPYRWVPCCRKSTRQRRPTPTSKRASFGSPLTSTKPPSPWQPDARPRLADLHSASLPFGSISELRRGRKGLGATFPNPRSGQCSICCIPDLLCSSWLSGDDFRGADARFTESTQCRCNLAALSMRRYRLKSLIGVAVLFACTGAAAVTAVSSAAGLGRRTGHGILFIYRPHGRVLGGEVYELVRGSGVRRL